MISRTLIVLMLLDSAAQAQQLSYSNTTTAAFSYGVSQEFGDVLNLSPSTVRHSVTRVELAFNNSTGGSWQGTVQLRLYDGEPFATSAVYTGSYTISFPAGNSTSLFDLPGVNTGSQTTVTIAGLGAGVGLRWFDPPSVGSSGDYFVARDLSGPGTGWQGLWFGGPPQVANIYAKVWSTPVASQPPVVRAVYLVPSDRAASPCATMGISNALKHLRAWYQARMPGGKTFTLHESVVEVMATPHTAGWYATNPNGSAGLWFWNNVLADAFALTGGGFNDPHNRWVFYIDADPACGQTAGAGTSGVAVLPANDLRGLIGRPRIPACPTEPVDTYGTCRWTGGLGHELGHALGLPHPPGCEDSDPGTPCTSDALMWVGYATYPNAVLLPADVAVLDQSPFMTVQPLVASASVCAAWPTACPADFNCSGGQSVQDIFDYLAQWFVSDPRTDFNGVGGITVQDIFDFLAAWFVSC